MFDAQQNTFDAQRNVSPLGAERVASARQIGISTQGTLICQSQ